MKFFEEADYSGYVAAKLPKICQNQHAYIFRFLFTEDSLKIQMALLARPHFCRVFFYKKTFCNITTTDQMSLRYCVYFESCSVKCISSFIQKHLIKL